MFLDLHFALPDVFILFQASKQIFSLLLELVGEKALTQLTLSKHLAIEHVKLFTDSLLVPVNPFSSDFCRHF